MEVVFEDDVGEDLQVPCFLQIAPGVEDDVSGFLTREDGKPAVDGACQEVGIVGIVDAVAGSGHFGLLTAHSTRNWTSAPSSCLGRNIREVLLQTKRNFVKGRSQAGAPERGA